MNKDENFFDQLRKQQSAESKKDSTTVNHVTKHASKSKSIVEEQCIQNTTVVSEQDTTETSNMPPECRRALVTLIRQGVILSLQKAKIFEIICRYQSNIRKHLADMYLKLVLDEKSGVAFIARVDEEDTSNNKFTDDNASMEETVSLISRRTLTLFDTLLLLILRKYYQKRETAGEQKVIIDIERIESNLTPFLPLTNNSKSERKNLNASLKKMTGKRILSSIPSSDDRYEITPIIRYVVNADFLETMLAEYHQLATDANLEVCNPATEESE
jgi:hypothetical protein